MSPVPKKRNMLFKKVVNILEEARSSVVRSVNREMVKAYWRIGHEIILEEQKGEKRAEYGKRIVENLSVRLKEKYGKGYSVSNLWLYRQFYLVYEDRNSKELFETGLSWSHYRRLMKIDHPEERAFYEIEASANHWSYREMERQISSLLFPRLLKSQAKTRMLEMAKKGNVIQNPLDVIKDPYILEFLDLPEAAGFNENDLESALINNLHDFLLELGQGFAFVARQKRLTLDGDHFYADLVFYHIKLKCYVIIDLKTTKLTPGDLGQIQMYVNYFDRVERVEGDNPSLGLILCTDKNDSMVEYVLGKDQEQIFASRYQLHLPTPQDLKQQLVSWQQQSEEK